eukprot:1755364-Rhodomonas_salina.3
MNLVIIFDAEPLISISISITITIRLPQSCQSSNQEYQGSNSEHVLGITTRNSELPRNPTCCTLSHVWGAFHDNLDFRRFIALFRNSDFLHFYYSHPVIPGTERVVQVRSCVPVGKTPYSDRYHCPSIGTDWLPVSVKVESCGGRELEQRGEWLLCVALPPAQANPVCNHVENILAIRQIQARAGQPHQ